IVGYGATSDAYHITSPDPTGAGAARAMQLAVAEAGIKPEDVGYINAHGTATKANDSGEAKAINAVFGDQVLVSSTKGMTGHLLGAAGAVEAVITCASLEKGILPANVGCFDQDPACPVNLVKAGQQEQDVEYALSNSFGFGGHNAVLAFRKWA
ncbi:beta-ketoacyl-[acyl-carrier-protein] synthase family protein, partial [Lactobacillus nasalidis]|uniref:beta-ketoacyl-[acyl-carrier-protein] synthase family protein n=3 Tax=Lactobacillus nasalidis TaxID=2797258 RepID=UPI0035A2202F